MQDLEGYLTGKRETSEYIQHEALEAALNDESPAKRARLAAAATTMSTAVAAAASDATAILSHHATDAAAAAAPDAAVEQSALRTILANERQLRDRNSMLTVPGGNFQRVLDLLSGVLKEDASVAQRNRDAVAAKERKEREDAARRRGKDSASGPKPSGRYQRETAPDTGLQQIGAQNLGLQQVGFAPIAAVTAAAAAANDINNTVAEGAPSVAAAAAPPVDDRRRHQQQQQENERREQHRHQQQQLKRKSAPPPPTNPVPIIMVPPAASALLNMINAKEFLENGVYATPDQAAAAGSGPPENGIYHKINRTIGRKNGAMKYYVTDKEPTKKEDWKRVIGVFCLGKPWQFKRFPFKGASTGDMVDTFQRVCGVYLHYSDEPVDPQVKKWNVKLIKISRHSRENDADVAREFWAHIDAFWKTQSKKDVKK